MSKYPLHDAIIRDVSIDLLRSLIHLSNHSIVNEFNPETGLTPLALAAVQGNAEAMEVLLERGANPEPILPEGARFIVSPLYKAMLAPRNAKECIKLLQKYGVDINAPTMNGLNALQSYMLSVLMPREIERCTKVIKVMQECGADINARQETEGEAQLTPLQLAVSKHYDARVKALLDCGADTGGEQTLALLKIVEGIAILNKPESLIPGSSQEIAYQATCEQFENITRFLKDKVEDGSHSDQILSAAEAHEYVGLAAGGIAGAGAEVIHETLLGHLPSITEESGMEGSDC